MLSPVLQTDFPLIQPLEQEAKQLPGFPIECLPPVMQRFVMAVAEHTQTAADMPAVIALGTLAVALQGKYDVLLPSGYAEQLSLYTVIIASPGERKSGVMHAMTKFLYDYERDYNEKIAPAVHDYKRAKASFERRIECQSEALKKKPDSNGEAELTRLEQELEDLREIHEARFFADDCSSEALTSLLVQNDGIFAVMSAEGGIFDVMAGRYSGKANFDVWLKGISGDNIRIDRMMRESEYIDHPALSAVLTIQPSILEEIMENRQMSGRGLLARFLYCVPESRIGRRTFFAPAIPEVCEQEYREMIYRLMDVERPKEAVHLAFSSQAEECMADYFSQNERFLQSDGQQIQDWGSKYPGYIERIAGLLHLADGKREDAAIEIETVLHAIEIGKYFLVHTMYAYSLMCDDMAVKKSLFVLSKIKLQKLAESKRSDLFRMCRGKYFKAIEDIAPVLEILESHGYIRLEEGEGRGIGRKPDARVLVNPAVFA